MLSQQAFKDGMKKLQINYRNYSIEEELIRLWYDHMKHLTDGEFNQSIDYVLENFSYPPTMADILKSVIRERTIL